MYLFLAYQGDTAKSVARDKPPFGAGLDRDVVSKVVRVEIWGSGVKDTGEDFCEFRMFDSSGNLLTAKRQRGH